MQNYTLLSLYDASLSSLFSFVLWGIGVTHECIWSYILLSCTITYLHNSLRICTFDHVLYNLCGHGNTVIVEIRRDTPPRHPCLQSVSNPHVYNLEWIHCLYDLPWERSKGDQNVGFLINPLHKGTVCWIFKFLSWLLRGISGAQHHKSKVCLSPLSILVNGNLKNKQMPVFSSKSGLTMLLAINTSR